MEDLIIKEVRKIKAELEQESENDFEIIFKNHQALHQIYKSRIIEKNDLEDKNKVTT
jgi:hypothetical protein